MLKVPAPIVSVTWLNNNLKAKNLLVFDATIAKVGGKVEEEKQQIPNAIFFDLENTFVNIKGEFPNTIPTKEHFQKEVQKLGVHNNSCIIVYDALGTYASPRVWWLFKLFGFTNIAVLNGGLPAWKKAGYATEYQIKREIKKGNFKAVFQENLLKVTEQVLKASNNKKLIVDARSEARFYATIPEPRKELRGGHIPNSKTLPYEKLQSDGSMKSVKELQQLFLEINPKNAPMIFSCGSGITACILALAADMVGYDNYSVYDGSWTEWASKLELPIEK